MHRRLPDDFEVGYREVLGPAEEWFLACTLNLAQGDGDRRAGGDPRTARTTRRDPAHRSAELRFDLPQPTR